MKKVFISYSNKDKEWVCGWLLHNLEDASIQVHIDFRDFEISQLVLLNIERAVEECEKTIVVLTPSWIASEYTNFEAAMLQTRDPLNIKKKIIPLMLIDCKLPRRLEILTWADFRELGNRESELERLIGQMKKDLEFIEPLPKPEPVREPKVDISRLPETGYTLFGRVEELKVLDDAWQTNGTTVISLVAYGGTGKSTLVNKWLEKMRWDNYHGAEKVFGWSFYSQGTSQRITSADIFVNEALRWFGDSGMADSARSPWDKGKRLAELIRQKKTLLILDGLEPLQSNFKHDKGAIQDPALAVLLKQLAKENPGLCVITTREHLTGIPGKSISQKDLEQISPEAGRALLSFGGICGTDDELEQATRNFGNHALAVNLLTAYLQYTPKRRHIRNASNIEDLKEITEEEGKHPRRVMQALADELGNSPELNVLHMIGLFDRPASAKEINWLRIQKPVPNLTDKIRWLDDEDLDRVIANLRRLRLIAPESHHNLGGLDAHPHVREHFAQRLKETNGQSFKQGHSHLYEFLTKSVPATPDKIEEMKPLLLAIGHGCQAGRHREALQEVYKDRIERGRNPSVHLKRDTSRIIIDKFGALSADLAGLSSFFEKPWRKPADILTKKQQAFVLSDAGLVLGLMCRFDDADEALRDAAQQYKDLKNWGSAAECTRHRSQFLLSRGRINKARTLAQDALESAEKKKDMYYKIATQCNLANILHQDGRLKEALEVFREAEHAQCKREPKSPYLFRLHGFRYFTLLIDMGNYKAVLSRASKTVEDYHQEDFILGRGLHRLSLGRAYVFQELSKSYNNLSQASEPMQIALREIREANQQRHLPHGLLARAEFNRYKRQFNKAWDDLKELIEIAEQFQMELFIADYHLEATRLCLAEGNRKPEANSHFKKATNQIKNTVYNRRNPEVLLIKAELEIIGGDKEAAKKTLKKAKDLIDKMGCHRLDIEVERLKKSF